MNVVIINDAAYVRGGADKIAIESARMLAARGHRVSFFSALGPVGPELLGMVNVDTVCLGGVALKENKNPLGAVRDGLWNVRAAARLGTLLAGMDRRNTVVHVHLYMGALSPAVIAKAIRLGFRTVLSVHDYFLTCPNGAYFSFPDSRACERRPLGLSCVTCHCDSRSRLHKPFRLWRGWLQRRAHIAEGLAMILPVSETCRRTVARHLPAGVNVRVLRNFVDLEKTEPVDVARNVNFVFSGRMERYKGPHLLAAAAAETKLPTVFCGSGPMDTEVAKIAPLARITGWLDKAALVREMREARAFVFPSIVPETFGLSAAEALALGLPVIAARGTAACEFVQDGVNGLWFDHGSAADLARAMRQLEDAELASRLGREAYRQFWSGGSSVDAHVNELEAVYAEVLPLQDRAAENPLGAASR